ncbi:MAG: GtrA family protein [Bacteroidaceae bacterium]|nr:GtrA family protein [Bacteroidaceae bacterium]
MNSRLLCPLVRRYLKFLASTLAGTAVDMLVLWLCADVLLPDTYGMKYVVSPCISFECAVVTNFTLAFFYVWPDRVSSPSPRSYLRHLAGYNLSCIGAFLVKLLLLLLFERLFHWHVLLCNVVALCFSGIINFLMNERIIFARSGHRVGRS